MIRILPLYWITTLIMEFHLHSPVIDVVNSFVFKPYFGENGQIWPVLIPGWTLNFEMFFYVLFGISLFMPRRVALVFLVITICSLSLTRSVVTVPADSPILLTYTNPLILEFLAGILIAELRFQGLLPGPKQAFTLGLLGFSGLWLAPMQDAASIWRFVWWGAPSVLLVAGAVSLEKHGHIVRITMLAMLGDASFSIYLCHPFIERTVSSAFGTLPGLRIPAVLLTSSMLGVLVFRFVESPITGWLRGATISPSVVKRIATAP